MPAGLAAFSLVTFALLASAHPHYQRHPASHARFTRRNQFSLQDTYEGQGFFDQMDFFSDADPTHGQVDFVTRDDAFASNLTTITSSGQALLRVDHTTQLQPGQPRKSVRISSKKTYGNSLVVLDLDTMPHGCGVWPAFWTTSATAQWPAGGEIDIIEGVDEPGGNQMTLHTNPGCTLDNGAKAQFSGQILANDCDANVDGNAGCGIRDSDPLSYGHQFNINGGGVFATLRDDSGVKIWRFARDSVPGDIASDSPDPSSWPAPKAFWSAATCNPDTFIDNSQALIFDITLCGDWAGAVFSGDGCPGSCSDFVADPGNFKNARFIVNSLKVYT